MIANYEFTVILPSDEEKMKDALSFVNGELQKAGVTITKQEDLGVKTLAYEIAKQNKGHSISSLVRIPRALLFFQGHSSSAHMS